MSDPNLCYIENRLTHIFLAFTEAAEELRKDRTKFARDVKRSLQGGAVAGVSYDNVLS